MTETRPWAGSVLTVSELVLLKPVTLIDCSLPATFELLRTPTQNQLESNNWHVINNAFSEPVSRADDIADYAPTQFLAEAFRNAEYEGIIYTSQMGSGKNVALFDVNVAEVASRQLHCVKKLSFEFRKVGATDYVEKYKEQFAGREQQGTQT
jgi:RES domain-containing protein